MTRCMREDRRWKIWEGWRKGLSRQEISRALSASKIAVGAHIDAQGGICPRQRRRADRTLSALEREWIGKGLAAGCGLRMIARHLKRAPSTISREIGRNGGVLRYSGLRADARAWRKARRPRHCLLKHHAELAGLVVAKLSIDWSPQQISGWLKKAYPNDPTMRVSHETIYRSLYIQARGVLKRELSRHLRRGQTLRIPRSARAQATLRHQIQDAVRISERPAEAQDRAVPGHWEGDLLCGGIDSQIATLVERKSRFTMLVKVASKSPAEVAEALATQVRELPMELRRSLTWDRGFEMGKHKDFTLATQMQVYFCDPQSPWQRGTNENTNGLLRQYLPKGQDMSDWSQEQLNDIAMRLNQRPRKTLDFNTPAEVLSSSVAMTGLN